MSPRAVLVLPLLASGCYPSAAFVGSSVRTLDCRTGEFVGELRVERSGSRKVKVVYEQLPGTVNLQRVELTPQREVLAGKDGRESVVEVRGRLADRCASAGVNLLASFPPSGATGFIEVEPVVPVEGPTSIAASADSGGFEYVMTLQCCGPEGAGAFAVTVLDAPGASDVAVEPPVVDCTDTEQHAISVRGVAPQGAARVRLGLEDRSTGATCEHTDHVAASN